MRNFVSFLVATLLGVTTAAQSKVPEYICDIAKPESKCDLHDVQLTAAHPFFRPISVDDPIKIKSFDIRSRSMPKLAAGVCQEFPNLEKFKIGHVDLEEIASDAFSGCDELTEVIIFANKLRRLDERLFKGITKLNTVYISNNFLEEIPLNLFKGHTNLRLIQFPGHKFTSISPEVFKDLSHLLVLDLSRNHLRDLDVAKLVQYTPELEHIWLGENDFKCSRLREMMNVLDSSGVTIIKRMFTPRERSYTPETVLEMIDGVECLTDAQFT